MVLKLETVVLALESEVMISKSGPDIFCRVVLPGPVDSRIIPEWLYIIWVHKGVRKKGALDLKKGATPRISSADLQLSGREKKFDQGGRTRSRFNFLQMILKKFARPIGDGEPLSFYCLHFFQQKKQRFQNKIQGKGPLSNEGANQNQHQASRI